MQKKQQEAEASPCTAASLKGFPVLLRSLKREEGKCFCKWHFSTKTNRLTRNSVITSTLARTSKSKFIKVQWLVLRTWLPHRI